ncbi:MAG: alpha/beta hydrolase [Segetibacter sp.]
MNFARSGSGDLALVFLHYFGGSSRTWSKVINKLNGEFRCIAVDLQGFGKSPSLGKGLSVSDSAQSVADLITTLQLKRYVLIGHSMGGKITLSLASRRPFGLESLVLIAPSPPTPEPMDAKERAQLMAAYNNRSALTKIINSITSKPLSDIEINNLVNDNVRASEIGWKSWIEYGSQEDISLEVSNINVPVLVISGQCDKKLSSSFLYNEFGDYFPTVHFEEIRRQDIYYLLKLHYL